MAAFQAEDVNAMDVKSGTTPTEFVYLRGLWVARILGFEDLVNFTTFHCIHAFSFHALRLVLF